MVKENSLNIAETEELEKEEVDALRYEITSYPSDMTLRVYFDKWKDRQLVIPEFQRNYVWDLVQASKLIESFLLGIPVPGVFLYKEQKSNKLLVIDGQQRIESVARFFNGTFGSKVFKLKNVKSAWEGKTYNELDEPDRYQLQDSILRATVVQQLSPDDHSSIYYIFERLNTGGVNLSPMEIRKCIYSGPFFKLLENLNKMTTWRALLDKQREDLRLNDIELILRILSLNENWEYYEKPMKAFLNAYMFKFKNVKLESKDKDAVKIASTFTKMCSNAATLLPEKPFHLRGRLNLGLMDSVMVACSKIKKGESEQIGRKYKKLLNNEKYIEAISFNTSDTVVLHKRFNIANEILLGG